MTEKQIMEALLQGKKLRDINWSNGKYVYLDDKGNLLGEKRKSYLLYLLDDDKIQNQYIEYIEYVDFNTALNHMLDGGKAKRLVFDANVKLHCSSDGIISDENNYTITLDRADYKTKDWILL